MASGRWGWVAVPFALALGAGLGWSGRELLANPAPAAADPTFSVVDVAEDSVGRTFRLNASAAWLPGGAGTQGTSGDPGSGDQSGSAAEGASSGAGTVTAVALEGAKTVKPGDRLYDVDLAPVVIAQGVVPSFRDLQIGAKGADVAQLQDLLRQLKFRSTDATGSYDTATANQVFAWKKSVGMSPDGVFESGRVVYVAKLPATIALASSVRVGAAAPNPIGAVQVMPDEPTFTIALPAGQAAVVQSGQQVTLSLDDKEWPARIGELAPPTEEGTVNASLEPIKGKDSICGTECDAVPLAGASGIGAAIVIVPRVTGPVVPTAALRIAADNSTVVLDEAGTAIPVTVKATAGGLAVVDGVAVGTTVRVPQAAAS